MTADWATWALQFLILMGVGRVWLALDANTKSLSDLREEIPKRYATKDETIRHHDEDGKHFSELHDRMHNMSDRVHNVDLRLTALDGSVQSARAELK